jgi:3-dehydroquinate dehydratase-2
MSNIVYVLNGPNLNLLGKREPMTYGYETLADVESLCSHVGAAEGFEVRQFQSNSESRIIDWIHQAREEASGIVINPGAYSHTSVAIRDALAAFEGPIMEVHISNIHGREAFRHHSYVSAIAKGVICGCGIQGYAFAIQRLAALLQGASRGENAARAVAPERASR